jgi:hypothetical protein
VGLGEDLVAEASLGVSMAGTTSSATYRGIIIQPQKNPGSAKKIAALTIF